MSDENSCEVLAIPLCDGIPYRRVQMPNLVNHRRQLDALQDVNQFWPLVRINCSPLMKELLCRVYAPPCGQAVENMARLAAICPTAKDGCEPLMTRFRFVWPDSLSCHRFQPPVPSSTPIPTTHIPQCKSISIPLCRQLTHYNTTQFPNLLGHRRQEEAGIEVHQFYPLVRVQCSAALQELLCRVYAPECGNEEANAARINHLCPLARQGCGSLMRRFGFQWPSRLDCAALRRNTRSSK